MAKTTPLFFDGGNVTERNGSHVINNTYFKENASTSPSWNFTSTQDLENVTATTDPYSEVGFIVSNIRLLKAVVLCVVVLILIFTMGKFILRVFSSYVEDDRKDDEISRRS
jgi:hypothetical protein